MTDELILDPIADKTLNIEILYLKSNKSLKQTKSNKNVLFFCQLSRCI